MSGSRKPEDKGLLQKAPSAVAYAFLRALGKLPWRVRQDSALLVSAFEAR